MPMTASLEPTHAPIDIEIEDEDLWELVPEFLANRRRDVDRLRAAVQCGDHATIQRLGHNMKGTGAPFGFQEITHLGAGLETAGRNAGEASAALLTDRLESYLARISVRCVSSAAAA